MTLVAVHQPDFLPYLGFFNKMFQADVLVIYDTAQFSRRGYHNRNRIKTSRGMRWVTVPVKISGFPQIREVDIDNSQDWPRRIWRSLELNYGKSQYFRVYAEDFERLFKGPAWKRLAELNIRLLYLLQNLLSIDTPLILASALDAEDSSDPTEKLVDLTRAAGGDTYLSGQGGRDYLDERRFRDVRLEYTKYEPVPYPQLWGAFVPNLSVLDALFNCGPETNSLLLRKPPSNGHRRREAQ